MLCKHTYCNFYIIYKIVLFNYMLKYIIDKYINIITILINYNY